MTRRFLPIKMIAAVGLTIALFASISWAQSPLSLITYKVVTGQSFASPDEAGLELQRAITQEIRRGCEPISMGTGVGASEEGTVYVSQALLKCTLRKL